VSSANRHYGESETGIYVVSGHPVFVFADGDEERRIQASPGDFVFVPPFTAHREENPAPEEEAVVVIARSTQEAIVVNLESLRAPLIGPLGQSSRGDFACQLARDKMAGSRLRVESTAWPASREPIRVTTPPGPPTRSPSSG
jgi:hypothetical protein